jgi:hypothetical protein
MTTWTEKLVISIITFIILGLSAWTCGALSTLQQELPAIYATKSELHRSEDIIENRLTRMENRIIGEIRNLKSEQNL